MTLVAWLIERKGNCERIAQTKSGQERAGWLEDAAYFTQAVEAARIARSVERRVNVGGGQLNEDALYVVWHSRGCGDGDGVFAITRKKDRAEQIRDERNGWIEKMEWSDALQQYV